MNKNIHIQGCLAGKILWVDLSRERIWTEPSQEYANLTLGGRGINSLIMLRNIKIGTKWSDPENLLCFGVGSLVGTMAPGACRVDVSTINVFNGGKGSANVGGSWGAELKYAGYDNLIIVGKSKKPVYLYISDSLVELRDAQYLWGKDVFTTEFILRKTLDKEEIEIAAIGPAGENLVRGSAIIVDTAKAAAGSGVGCVMGDKKLKAIVVRGKGKIEVADPGRFMAIVEKTYQKCKQNPATRLMRQAPLNLYADSEWEGWYTNMVTRNGQDDYWESTKRQKLMNSQSGVPSMIKGVRACYLCPTGCLPFLEIEKGKYQGDKGEGFWINTIMGHACRLDISEPEAVVESWILTNRLGLDGDYVASVTSWAFELYEKGIISQKEAEGLTLNWGNSDSFLALIKKIAYREGIGDILADGIALAAKRLGKNSEYYSSQIKGQPSIEPFRIPKGWALAVATSPVAGRHLRGATMGSTRYGPKPRPGNFNSTDYSGQAQGVVWQAKTKELEDNLGICSYVSTWSGANFLEVSDLLELINSGMGVNLSEEDLMEFYALKGRNLEKVFNLLHTNLSRKDDLPPQRFMREKVKKGPYKGVKMDKNRYNKILEEFYTLWGWDTQTGLPTKTGLISSGLEEVVEPLIQRGKLIEK
ncbi:MAG: aldehyde ferredoxin oxidoreductase family protein [Candidatus Caldatribacteriota bacterium]